MPLDPLPIIPGIVTVVPPNFSDVAASVTPVTLLAANALRKTACIYNDSNVSLFVKFGTGVTTSNFTVRLDGHDYYEFPIPIYIDTITGVWSASTGSAKITEFV